MKLMYEMDYFYLFKRRKKIESNFKFKIIKTKICKTHFNYFLKFKGLS